MCGRFTLVTTARDLAKKFEVEIEKSISPRYNIFPSQVIFAIAKTDTQKRILDVMQWGLIPSWIKKLNSWKANLINARAETIESKPSFKAAFKYRPCLIPASGFYEWNKQKQPHYFQLKKQPLFALAGIWESWSNGADELITCTIVTTKANEKIAKVHHRMPVIIRSEDYNLWLGEFNERKRLLANLPEVDLDLYPVSKIVNSPKNNTSDCIEPI